MGKFHFVKPSDAGAKGHQGIQSRIDDPKKYLLSGTTGKEKVIITDGDDIQELTLNKTDTILYAKNGEITISYINDECCKPDMNVMFTTGEPKAISTAQNTFPQDYQSNWNCSSCPYKGMQNPTKRKKLLSRNEKLDLCRLVAQTDDGSVTETKDDCDNCKILDDGQFCQPGNYTVIFKTKNKCKGVTFGGCNIPETVILKNATKQDNAKACQIRCQFADNCRFYKFDNQTKLCTLLRNDYRSFCKIMAGPVDKKATYCLEVEPGRNCDAEVEENCEYNGKYLDSLTEGSMGQPGDCQAFCEARAPDCKYWIHDANKGSCILKRDDERSCDIWGGPKTPSYQICRELEGLDQLD